MFLTKISTKQNYIFKSGLIHHLDLIVENINNFGHFDALSRSSNNREASLQCVWSVE